MNPKRKYSQLTAYRRNRSFVSICHKPIYVKQALSHYIPNPLTPIP
jgi:hypothetical protein